MISITLTVHECHDLWDEGSMVTVTLSCFTHFSVHLVISIQTLRNEDRTRNMVTSWTNWRKKKKKKKKLAFHITSIETELHIFEHLLTNINWTIKDNQTNCFFYLPCLSGLVNRVRIPTREKPVKRLTYACLFRALIDPPEQDSC